MNILLVGITAALMAGGTAAYVVWDQMSAEDRTTSCVEGPPAPDGVGPGLIVFRVDNEGPAQDVVVCLHQDGAKIAQRSVRLPANQVTRIEMASPLSTVAAELDVGANGDGPQGWTSANLRLCPERAATTDIRVAPSSIGINGANCSTRNADVRHSGLDPGGVIPAGDAGPPLGPVFGVGFGVAGVVGLLVHLRGKIHFAGLLLFTRLARHRVLDQDTRQRIHELVEAEPGIHANAIGHQLDLAQGQLLYHLHVLVRERAIAPVRNFGFRQYFVAGRYGPDQMRALAAMKMPGLEPVYRAVRANPGQPLSRLAAQVGLSLGRVSRVSRRLESAGLVERRRSGREVMLFPQGTPASVRDASATG